MHDVILSITHVYKSKIFQFDETFILLLYFISH